MFSTIFVADSKIIFRYDFVAALRLLTSFVGIVSRNGEFDFETDMKWIWDWFFDAVVIAIIIRIFLIIN